MDNCQLNTRQKLYNWSINILLGIGLLRCVQCNSKADYYPCLCKTCHSQLPWHQDYCSHCGIRLSESLLQKGFSSCGHCLVLDEIPFARVHVCFHFEQPVQQWINQYKFHKQLIYSRLFGSSLVEVLESRNLDRDLIVLPMPLHSKRLSERGFNQSQLVAKRVAKGLNMELCLKTLQRHQDTPHQIGLSKKQRQQNVKSAFCCKLKPPKKVLLIDDVMTTGSTAYAAAKCLKKQGAQHIELALIARAG